MMFLVLMLQGLGRFASVCVVLRSLLLGYEESEDGCFCLGPDLRVGSSRWRHS